MTIGFSFLTIACGPLFDNCLCTDQFITHEVSVVDSKQNLLDSLTVQVKSSVTGHEYLIDSTYQAHNPPGYYTIIHDGFKKDMPSSTDLVEVVLENEHYKAAAHYLIEMDECSCHISISSGNETIEAFPKEGTK